MGAKNCNFEVLLVKINIKELVLKPPWGVGGRENKILKIYSLFISNCINIKIEFIIPVYEPVAKQPHLLCAC